MQASLIDHLGLSIPLVQAPMAGVSTPALAAAVAEQGALGSIGAGATDAAGARAMIDETRPVIAAGGLMDGAGIASVLDLGAVAAQLGTAFIACPESAADDAYRAALTGPGAYQTSLTSLISGRPARALANRFVGLAAALGDHLPPDYPIAYDAGKALHAVAKAEGEHGFGAQWAGQGAPLARAMPAAELVQVLRMELQSCRGAF